MSWLRTLGAFFYATIICALYAFISSFGLINLIDSSGFWKTSAWFFANLIVLAWLSENGIEIASLAYNWLWDKTIKTRIATIIPAIIIGIYNLSLPFRLEVDFSFVDWILSIIWIGTVIFFYYNWILFPFINTDIGWGINIGLKNKSNEN